MKTINQISPKLDDALADAAPADCLLAKQIERSKSLYVVEEGSFATLDELDLRPELLEQNSIAVSSWPASDYYGLAGFRLLAQSTKTHATDFVECQIAIEWIAEVSNKNGQPLVAHTMRSDEDSPIHLIFALRLNRGDITEHLDVDCQDLLDRFPRVVERIMERLVLVGRIVTWSQTKFWGEGHD